MNPIKSFINDVVADKYNGKEYLQLSEMTREQVPSIPAYTYEKTSKVQRIALEIILGILSVVFLPYGIYRLLHLVGGVPIVPAQIKGPAADKLGIPKVSQTRFVEQLDERLKTDNSLVAKRISVCVNGKLVDAMIIGKKENINNKKWTLISNPNAVDMKFVAGSRWTHITGLIDTHQTNVLFYDYQGTGSSEGVATRDEIVSAHEAMLQFFEDEEKGIGAKEILQIGISIGGGVQGHAMKTHKLKEGVKYVLVKDDSFSKISKVRSPILGGLIKFLGWELSSMTAAKKMEEQGVPEIILQTGNKKGKRVAAEDVWDDGVISAKASLGCGLLKLKNTWNHKKVILHYGAHATGLACGKEKLFKAIKSAFDPDYQGFHVKPAAVAV